MENFAEFDDEYDEEKEKQKKQQLVKNKVPQTLKNEKKKDFQYTVSGLIDDRRLLVAVEAPRYKGKSTGYKVLGNVHNFKVGYVLTAKNINSVFFKSLKNLTSWIAQFELDNFKLENAKIDKGVMFILDEKEGIF